MVKIAAYGPGDLGSNPGVDRYIIEFTLIIQFALAKICDPDIGGSLVGSEKQQLKLNKFGGALRIRSDPLTG